MKNNSSSSLLSDFCIYGFREDIQGLRAISVVAVILFHVGVPGFAGGFIGVDVFFVISGYLMSAIISRDLEENVFTFSNFYMRRIRRILPAVFFTLFITLVGSWFVLFPKDFEDFADVMGASVLFLSNAVLMNQSSGYFAVSLENHPLLHMWSLAVEEQFYLIFPVFFVLLLRFCSAWLCISISTLTFAGSLWLAEVYYPISPSATFFHLPGRVFEFFVGVLAFLFVRKYRTFVLASEFTSALGLALIVGSLLFFDSSTPTPSLSTLIPLFGVFLILINVKDGRARKSRVLAYKPLVFIGSISFSLYLLHQPILALLRYQGVSGLLPLTLSMVFAFGCAWLMKTFVEDFFRYRVDPTRLGYGLVASGILVIGFTLLIKQNSGMPERFDGNLLQAVSTAVGSPYREKCHTDGEAYLKPQQACRYPDGALKWAVVGDSHAVPIAYALSEKIKERGESLVHLTFSGCGFSKAPDSYCRQWLSEVERYLVAQDSVTHVILSFRLMAQLFGRHEFIYPEIPQENDEGIRREILQEYSRFISNIQSSGKQVVWIMQPPEVGDSMVSTLRSIDLNQVDAQSVPYSWWRKRSGDAPELVRKATPQGVFVVWPEEWLCHASKDMCFAIMDGNSYYRDRDHLSIHGAEAVVDKIFDYID